ncbi:MAG: hypothetical protein ABIT96_02710 [Ferruginibacter sp.]
MKIAILIFALFAGVQLTAGNMPSWSAAEPAVKQATPPAFAFLRGHRQARAAVVTWGMSSNSGIYDFDIELTYEDPTDPYSNWEYRGEMPNSNGRSFKFTDNDVLGGVMHYRIVANMNDGSRVVSDCQSIKIPSR